MRGLKSTRIIRTKIFDRIDIRRDINVYRVSHGFQVARLSRLTDYLQEYEERENAMLRILNRIGFNWIVLVTVAFGFLASSYCLFALSAISPALYYIYPPNGDLLPDVNEVLDLITLCSTFAGMIISGHLADRFGRSYLYGLELFIIILACAGMVQASQGYMTSTGRTMDIYQSFAWWRALLGLGIGSEYPMSAVIAAEFTSTDARATMMACVFLMQSVGRVLAFGVGLGSLRGLSQSMGLRFDDPNDDSAKFVLDAVWRIVVGIGGLFAVVAVGLRAAIPETPRFYLGIERDLRKAEAAIKKLGGRTEDLQSISSGVQSSKKDDDTPAPVLSSAWRYLKKGGWRKLLAISMMWLLLDVCFYGMGLDTPQTLNSFWLDSDPPAVNGTLPVWEQNPAMPNASIARILDDNAGRTLELSFIASFVGGLCAIVLVNFADRRKLLVGTSLALVGLLIITGICVLVTYAKPSHTAILVFFSFTQFLFNLGPNTLIFILAAEIFPTVFRGTFYGFAAAMGKVGAIIVRAILPVYSKGRITLAVYMFVFSLLMALVAVIGALPGSLPEVQHLRKKKGKETAVETGRSAGEDDDDDDEDDEEDDDEDEDGPRKAWMAWLPRRLKNKHLERIAPNPQPDELVAALNQASLEPPSALLASEYGNPDEAGPSTNNIPLADYPTGATHEDEEGTQVGAPTAAGHEAKTLEDDIEKRFYPGST
jgi:PHS family inorganic phosphate transporter-like MFS transporter